MNIYLDDERPCPEGYVLYRDAESLLEAIQKNPAMLDDCVSMSLDYQIGTLYQPKMNGAEFLKALFQLHFDKVVDLSDLRFEVHSKHPTGAREMKVMLRDFRWNI